MSIAAVAWALDVKCSDPIAKLILITLAEAENAETGECWPSVDLLADRAECTRRSVFNKLNYLVEQGYIETRSRSTDNGRQTTNSYRLLRHQSNELGVNEMHPRGEQAFTGEGEYCFTPLKRTVRKNRNNISAKTDISSAKGFDEFWKAYAHKKGKEAALKVWKRKNLASKAEAVIAGARAYVKTRGDDPRYWKHPQGWLNDGRWEDHGSVSEPKTAAVDWENRARMFYDKGIWLPDWGPSPDYSGCECPPEFLRTLGREAAE